MKKTVVAVALSGGIDSLVTGYLLKQQYKEVFGLHFTTGFERKPVRIEQLEKQLGFPVQHLDLSAVFDQTVVQYFIRTYLEGKTPNPCLICNKTIKFGVLLDKARQMGADMLATGHYATIGCNSGNGDPLPPCLKNSADIQKDQSYFLSLVPPALLNHVLFPLSSLTKPQVRKTAQDNGLAPLFPSESQDICFVHDNNFSGFIIDRLDTPAPEQGDIVDVSGKVVGRHKGLFRYTVGQRRGLDCPASEPYYVRKIDINNNRLLVCFKKDLQQTEFVVSQLNWNYFLENSIPDVMTKIRYNHKGAMSCLYFKNNKIRVVFDEPQMAVTPGQAAVFYKNGRVLGAGIIQ